jgi:phosphotransferase system enzyme I (PtsP)
MIKDILRMVEGLSRSANLATGLQWIVEQIKEFLGADACHIFLLDEESGHYELVVSSIVDVKTLLKTAIPFGQGLVGQIAERAELMSVENAKTHEWVEPLVELLDDDLHGYCGVPVVYAGEVLAVLVVQKRDIAAFSDDNASFLMTLAVLMGSQMAYAHSHGALHQALSKGKRKRKSTVLSGVSGAPGVAIGQVKVIYPLADFDSIPEKIAKDVAHEIGLFDQALAQTKHDIQSMAAKATERLSPSESVLFQAYLRILQSPKLRDDMKNAIEEGHWVQMALKLVIQNHVQQFNSIEDEYLKERAHDIEDLGRRILMYLQHKPNDPSIQKYPKNTILIGDVLSASDLIEVPQGQLKGVACSRGSQNSHVAILARAMGVPALMGVSGASLALVDTKEAIIDAYNAHLYLSPSLALKKEFQLLELEDIAQDQELEALRHLPSETIDGHRIELLVNADVTIDPKLACDFGAEGVGLYRTETAFMLRDTFPTEYAQTIHYRQLLSMFVPKPVVIRTLDAGGDKALDYLPIEEDNPFLGWRGIRITLDQPEIFLQQIKALLHAHAEFGNLRIMLPMISSISEVEHSQGLIHQAFAELEEDGLPISMPPLGVMIEVPSSVFQAYEIAKRVDFLSVGTNDLIQYLLAVDRNNARVAHLYDPLHPAVLRALKMIISSAHKAGKKASVCGEMAADPLCAVVLLGMGYDMLSLNARAIPKIKLVIRTFSYEKAKMIANDVLAMDDAQEIRLHLEYEYETLGLGGLIRAGR